LPAELANLARYDGVRYGLREPADSVQEIFFNSRGKGFGAEVKRRIMLVLTPCPPVITMLIMGSPKVRTLIKDDFEQAFQAVDVIAARWLLRPPSSWASTATTHWRCTGRRFHPAG